MIKMVAKNVDSSVLKDCDAHEALQRAIKV
jgi:hypothetical protein